MGLFSRRKAEKPAKDSGETILYKDYKITPTPAKASGGFRVEADITREKDGQVLSHHMIRSDVIQSREEALKITEAKAKITIDQLGDAIFVNKK